MGRDATKSYQNGSKKIRTGHRMHFRPSPARNSTEIWKMGSKGPRAYGPCGVLCLCCLISFCEGVYPPPLELSPGSTLRQPTGVLRPTTKKPSSAVKNVELSKIVSSNTLNPSLWCSSSRGKFWQKQFSKFALSEVSAWWTTRGAFNFYKWADKSINWRKLKQIESSWSKLK